MAFTSMLPIVWGISTGKLQTAIWIALTAESICWVELKGTFDTCLRVLLAGALLALMFTFLGSISGGSLLLSLVLMLLVAFAGAMFKNLGDRGGGLAVCVYVMFIISNAYPATQPGDLTERMILTGIGCTWAVLTGIVASLYVPAQAPFRRTIAMILRANAALLQAVSKGWNGTGLRSNYRSIYLKTKDVRAAIDHSLLFHETVAKEQAEKEKEAHDLSQIRRMTALAATNIEAISEELQQLKIQETDFVWRQRFSEAMKSLEDVLTRMSVYMLLLKPEEELLLLSRIEKLQKKLLLLKTQTEKITGTAFVFEHLLHLSERIKNLLEAALSKLQEVGSNASSLHPYPLLKSVMMMHPAKWFRNVRLLFNPNSNTLRYAIRSAIAATFAFAIYRFFHIKNGYWLPFTVMLVMQPYFRATIKKAFDRVLGTIFGVIAGGMLLAIPTGFYFKEAALFLSFIGMIYFVRKQYTVSAFFITLNLLLLLNLEHQFKISLVVTRVLATIGGSAIAVLAGFALLPTWDRKLLPKYLSKAVSNNKRYFHFTFYNNHFSGWTKHKRLAESANSNAYDSFTRYMQEPRRRRRTSIFFYQLISHQVRITRLLNNINIENESETTGNIQADAEKLLPILSKCNHLFDELTQHFQTIEPNRNTQTINAPDFNHTPVFSTIQMQYLEKIMLELMVTQSDILEFSKAAAGKASVKSA